MMRSIVLASVCLFLALGGVASASQPAGLYVLVEEVELDPGNAPKWIKIRGVFMNEPSFDDRTGDTSVYGPVQGWLKFDLPPSKPDLARLEWKDLATAKGKVVAFGSAYTNFPVSSGAVRHFVKEDPRQIASMAYPIDHGMYLLRDDSKPARDLRTFRIKNPVRR